MILPQPSDLKKIERYPLTLTLVALNVFLFLLIFSGQSMSINQSPLFQSDRLLMSGRLYYQYLQKLPPEQLYQKPEWVRQMTSNNFEQMETLGALSLRDSDFMKNAESQDYWGDEVQIELWKKDLIQFKKEYKNQLQYRFGLSSLENKPLSWFTYQFSHSSWIHLISNMLFLLLVGAAVEVLVGSHVLLFVYLMGGIFGGWGFLLFDGSGTIPMVGASASISALLAFYCVAELRPRMRYFYFISPLEDHMGHIYLPTLMIVPLFLVVDLANLWSSPAGLNGSVAYAAHLGGTFLGFLVGVAYRWLGPILLGRHPQFK